MLNPTASTLATVQDIPTKKLAIAIAGVVTVGNSKIHGSTFSTDPSQCKTGQKLAKIEGTSCNKCYALRLAKVYPSAQKSWTNNLEIFRKHQKENTLDLWAAAIAKQIIMISNNKSKKGISGAYQHRWFTAGDLDSVDMLRAICLVAELTPFIDHWLPTQEAGMLRQFHSTLGTIPDNLVVRISATKINDAPRKVWFNTSTTHSKGTTAKHGYACPAQEQKGSCNDCTACWDDEVKNISYEVH
ncbi:hypothetical protein N9937_00005 [bacterium]|nr:hypothetical protein [bacterium]